MLKKIVLSVLLICFVASFNMQATQEILNHQKQKFEAIPWPFTICGDNAEWTVESVTLDQTPKRNINDDIDVTGTAKKAITFSKVQINVKLNGAFLDKQVIPFTNAYDEGDSVQFKYKNYVPSFAPFGTYVLTFQSFDSKNNINGCFIIQFKI